MTLAFADLETLAENPDMQADDPGARPATMARLATIEEILPLLVSPDDGSALARRGNWLVSTSGLSYPIEGHLAVLLPRKAINDAPRIALSQVDPAALRDPLLQYLYLNVVKNAGGEANSEAADVWYGRHLHRARGLLADATGLILDVGCDDPDMSRSVFPAAASYIGLEPSRRHTLSPRLAGMAEFLPFADESLDGIAFMTSLDHVFDHHSGIEEAWRVLRSGGMLYLATLIWTDRAALYKDNIHFHHFRGYEIVGLLRNFQIESATRFNWKNDQHRFGLYLSARKP